MSIKTIVAVSGSLRKASSNTGLLRALQKYIPANYKMDIIVPGDLPLFDQDLEAGTLPDPVLAFRSRLKVADAFVFACPEYNYSVTGALKNAIDWGSRGPDGGNLWAEKPAAVLSAGGGAGGLRAQNHMRDIAVFANLYMMNHPQIMLPIYKTPSPIDWTTGYLTDIAIEAEVKKFAGYLIRWIERNQSMENK